ncbi:FAD-binding oxidoreductase [Pseudoalteromonas sp. J010]|uniref:NAD(P)/FAD-dependent oxidoreductase n=1 Tax=Pseudoalteromonas sp. J010 TaxID=998465 RepID=UPI000F653361|nr:FAD-dependent oxidoreductase [Pseudoalteromonas sp. J010]RRS08331.1 FAD-binding oxidoreductase [Pseudoalteromonas sp. J010]
MENNNNIAVIGAGIIGITTALQLTRRGHAVTLIDKNQPAEGCSMGNAGHFATEQIFPMADADILTKVPSMLVNPVGPLRIETTSLLKNIPWFVRFLKQMKSSCFHKGTIALRSLNERALPAYQRLLGDKYHTLISSNGSLLVFEGAESVARQSYHKYAEQDISVSLLTGDQAREMEPSLSNTITSALYFDKVAHSTDPYALCLTLYEQFMQLGGTFKQGSIDNITHTGHGYTLHSKSHMMAFNKVVVATGAASKTLCASLGYSLPMIAERGYHNMLAVNNTLTRPVASSERGFIMTPMTTGLRLAGTVEFATLESKPNYSRAHALLHHARMLLNSSLPQENDNLWVGCRPSLPDYLPVIGQAPNHHNLYFALGHQHLGLTQAAISSECIADLIDNKPNDIDLTPFSIARFN